MKYLIAALPIAALVACGGGGGGGGGGSTGGAIQNPNVGTASISGTTGTVVVGGNTYSFTNGGIVNGHMTWAGGTLHGVSYSSSNVTMIGGVDSGAVAITGVTAPNGANAAQMNGGGTAQFTGMLAVTDGRNYQSRNITMTADFGAATPNITGIATDGSGGSFTLNATIDNTGVLDGTVAFNNTVYGNGFSADFDGGLYGTNEMAGVFGVDASPNFAGPNPRGVAGVIYGTQ